MVLGLGVDGDTVLGLVVLGFTVGLLRDTKRELTVMLVLELNMCKIKMRSILTLWAVLLVALFSE